MRRRCELSVECNEIRNVGSHRLNDVACWETLDADVRTLNLGSSLYCRVLHVSNGRQEGIKNYDLSTECKMLQECLTYYGQHQ